MPLAVMLRSVVDHLDERRALHIYIIADGIGADDRKRVEDSLAGRASTWWLAPRRSGFSGLPLWGRMPIATYDKITVAEILPESVGKAIWLDCDVLVMSDLAMLWDTPLDEFHAMAVRDTLVPSVSSRFGVAGFADLGLDPVAPYFNAGVMVINLSLWRSNDIKANALRYLQRYRARVYFWDQEGLNAALSGKWSALDPRWNWSANLDRLSSPSERASSSERGKMQPRIVHFSGNLKPWAVSSDGEYDVAYLRALDETAWADWRPRKTWRGKLLVWYGSSRLRRTMYPTEQWTLRIVRGLTYRYAVTDA